MVGIRQNLILWDRRPHFRPYRRDSIKRIIKMKIDHSILRLVAIIIGGESIFLGYLLFIKGITGKATLIVGADSLSGQLINAAPGLFFAISGVIIIMVSLYRKVIEEFKNGTDKGALQYLALVHGIRDNIDQIKTEIDNTSFDHANSESQLDISNFLRKHFQKLSNGLKELEIKMLKRNSLMKTVDKDTFADPYKGIIIDDDDLDIPTFLRKIQD